MTALPQQSRPRRSRQLHLERQQRRSVRSVGKLNSRESLAIASRAPAGRMAAVFATTSREPTSPANGLLAIGRVREGRTGRDQTSPSLNDA
jgi:hypothetical protein